jgi:hypothetical protein
MPVYGGLALTKKKLGPEEWSKIVHKKGRQNSPIDINCAFSADYVMIGIITEGKENNSKFNPGPPGQYLIRKSAYSGVNSQYAIEKPRSGYTAHQIPNRISTCGSHYFITPPLRACVTV